MKTNQLIISTFFLSFFFSIVSLKAEAKYQPGFIITNSNDTVRGFIQGYGVNAYTHCYFKKTLNDKAVEYSPGNILAYRFDGDGKFYISKEAPLESGNKVLFLEYLIKGKARVYFMRDDMDHYFIETENRNIMEISEYPKIAKGANGTSYYKESQYKGKLKYIMSDCPEIASEIEHSSLNPTNMINLAKDYHNRVCNSEQCTIFERKIKPVKIYFSIVGGIALNKFKIAERYTNLNPEGIIGCKVEFENFFFSSEKSTIQLGLLFQNYSNYTIYNANTTFFSNHTIKSDLNTVAVRIPLIYKYTFLHEKIRPYIGVGMANVFVISKNTDFSFQDNVYDQKKAFPFYQVGYMGVIGTKFMLNNKHAMNLELGYEYNQSIGEASHYKTIRNGNFSLTLGYTL